MESIKIITANKKAYHEYFIDETYEEGIVLAGSEVKSVRLGHIILKDEFWIVRAGEMRLDDVRCIARGRGRYFVA